MLARLVKEHHAKQSARKEKQGNLINMYNFLINLGIGLTLFRSFPFCFIEVKRKEAIAAANDLTQALVEHLNLGSVFLILEFFFRFSFSVIF